ncbi:MAG: ribonuclease III [Christensenellaceae bacterium]|nr:ribonuclease III [Christensenellaceae bacterium]
MKLESLMHTIQYSFKEPGLLRRALTHSSCETGEDYERLEFLGDAVLELAVSDFLYANLPAYSEGKLTKTRAQLVCEASLAAWARENDLGKYLILGKSEENSGGRDKSSILCDVTEAIIGAVYLDGGMAAARQLIGRVIAKSFNRLMERGEEKDAKSQLQIELQKNGNVDICYEVTGEEGPPHDRTFHVQVSVNGKCLASGTGRSKKQAEQAAAAQALRRHEF